jgi:alkanesulfonate monooxygenase SsuD/methylene tetrahydromethanopterin reductase-like flavin-dependent oxidoreductase (luciferase family)
MEFVARHRYAYMGIPYFHFSIFERTFGMFRDICREQGGYEPDPLQAGWLTPIYVAETDEQARAEYEPHFWYWVRKLLPGITIQPPGYTSVRSLQNILRGAGHFAINLEHWDQVVDGRYAIVGSPETVTEILVDSLERLETGNLLGLFQLGSLPAAETQRNLQLFGEEVLPVLKERFPDGAPMRAAAKAATGADGVRS